MHTDGPFFTIELALSAKVELRTTAESQPPRDLSRTRHHTDAGCVTISHRYRDLAPMAEPMHVISVAYATPLTPLVLVSGCL